MSAELSFATLFVALPTPFDEKGRIDEKSLLHLVEYLLTQKVAGIALLTEAAEDAVLTEEERRQILSVVGGRVGGSAELLVSISAPGTKEALHLARHAEAQGVRRLLISPLKVPGIGYRELYRHVDLMVRGTKLTPYVTLRPENAASALAPEELHTLLKHEALKGVFLPMGSSEEIKLWARRFKDRDGAVLSGCGLSFQASARAGARAVVCGLSMIALDATRKLLAAIVEGDVDRIRKLEKKVAPAVESLGPPKAPDELEGVKKVATKIANRPLEGYKILSSVPFGLIKEALRLQGHPVHKYVRAPFEAVGEEQSERLKSLLKAAGLLS